MKPNQIQMSMNILLLKENGQWVAQCLQYDLAAQGPTIPEALENFECVLCGHVALDLEAGEDPLFDLDPAPNFYWQWYHKAEPLAKSSLPNVPPPWMIQAMVSDLRVF